jgi:hypothetical protein
MTCAKLNMEPLSPKRRGLTVAVTVAVSIYENDKILFS